MCNYIIGIDTGGTYTDACVIDGKGCVTIVKAPTTPEKLETGVSKGLIEPIPRNSTKYMRFLGMSPN